MGFLTSALGALGALGGGSATGAFLAGGNALTGVLANRASARTSTSQQANRSSSTTRSRRVLRPEQESLMNPLAQQALGMMQNPGAGLEPIAIARRGAVNRAYAAAPAAIAAAHSSTGGGRSGKKGRATREAELARLGALAGVDSDVSRLTLDRQDAGASLAERLLGMTFEQEGSTAGLTDANGTAVGPGSAAAGGLGGGLETISALLAMQRLLGGA